MADGFSSDVVTIPVVVMRRTYAIAALIVILTALACMRAVRRNLDRVDIVSTLKRRE
jgi:putative ABC transport system permease protein